MIQTPYYLIDKSALLRNLQIIDQVRQQSGAKVLLALKCFGTWSVFDVMRPYMDGTTSSSLYEVKLGHDKFGGETHAYSVAFADHEIAEVVAHSDKVIFNSISQFLRFEAAAGDKPKGLRLNPGISHSGFDLADPARAFSRLGDTGLNRPTGGRPNEDMRRELLRGMLKQWLDENLPELVERLVREEIERVVRTGR